MGFPLLYMALMLTTATAVRDTPRTMCGRALAQTRLIYCLTMANATHGTTPQPYSAEEVEKIQPKDVYPTELAALAQQMKPWSERYLELVEECCRNPCYLSQLLSYC